MRRLFPGRGDHSNRLAPEIRAAVPLGPGERILAHSTDTATGSAVVLTSWSLAAVDPTGGLLFRRPWSDTDGGGWAPRTKTVSVTWVDGSRPAQWSLASGGDRVAEVFRERVQASVALSAEVRVGDPVVARAAVRKDLHTGALFEQVVYGRGVRRDAPGVVAAVDAVLADLRDQTGL